MHRHLAWRICSSQSQATHLKESYSNISRYVRSRYLLVQATSTTQRRTFGATGHIQSLSAPAKSEEQVFQEFAESCRFAKYTRWGTVLGEEKSTIHYSSDAAEGLSKSEDASDVPIDMYLNGYITAKRPATPNLTFCTLVDPHLRHAVQLKIELGNETAPKTTEDHWSSGDASEAGSGDTGLNIRRVTSLRINAVTSELLQSLTPHTPVQVKGRFVDRPAKASGIQPHHDKHVGHIKQRVDKELEVQSIRVLNSFPSTTNAQSGRNFPPEQRHLQLRTNSTLRDNLRYRSFAMAIISKHLFRTRFDQIETPILFKSTPEGAREFIVPTRKKGLAYALSQSPQQYKQLLMASGIYRYFQFAKCFRDEDLRTDRQPEFTQVDLEMAFASPSHVMALIERLLDEGLLPAFGQERKTQDYLPNLAGKQEHPRAFPVVTYQWAMAEYGSDKPALQWEGSLRPVQLLLPKSLIGMLTSLSDPIVEALVVRPKKEDPTSSREFINGFMSSPTGKPYIDNPDGMPGVTVIDPSKPSNGLAAFGHEAADQIQRELELSTGDILIIQPRPNAPFSGGSTPLGNLRVDVNKAAHAAGLLQPRAGLHWLWVTEFPLFSRLTDADIASGTPSHTQSTSGLISTHHPFTAPLPKRSNIALLSTDPAAVVGDHFDLVVNGVEVGGGSRRIHNAALQEYVFRDVLKLPEEQIEAFRPLLNALKDGCPPHTGFAIGFDRLLSVLRGTETVREVIAFPKTGDGEDRFVGSPTRLSEEQLRTYGLEMAREGEVGEENVGAEVPEGEKISLKS